MFDLKEIKNRNYYYNDLYYDFIFDFKKIKHNYFYDYTDIRDFNTRAKDVSKFYDDKMRNDVSEILEKINRGYKCGNKTLQNIKSLGKSSTMVVVGGQQPGLFGGPLFIIYKIISIIKLSIFLTGYLKQKVVPVFWNASDDSNFSQVNSAYFFDKEGNIFKEALSEEEASITPGGTRYSDINLSRNTLEKLVLHFTSELQNTEFTSWIKELVLHCIPETTNQSMLTDFFSNIITSLFKEYGLVIFDPAHPALKEMALQSAFFDIENHDAIENALTIKAKFLEEEGYHSQLKVEKNAMNFFIVSEGRRNRVKYLGDGIFTYGEKKASKKELENILTKNPQCLSLNVVLRPVLQDSVMPVLATVCGPGEASYFAQIKEVYEIFSKKTGVIYPRLSASIIEKKVEKSIYRINQDYESIIPEKNKMIENAACMAIKVNIDSELVLFEDAFISGLVNLKKSMTENGLEIDASFGRIENNIKKEISVLRKKIISELSNKKTSITKDVNKVIGNIFPLGMLQERVYNVFNYINKYGPGFIEEIIVSTDIRAYFHRFMIISSSR